MRKLWVSKETIKTHWQEVSADRGLQGPGVEAAAPKIFGRMLHDAQTALSREWEEGLF